MTSRTAIVTGAAGGIGAAIVGRLARRGMNVVLVDLDAAAVARVARDLDLAADAHVVVAADVSAADQVEAYVEQAVTAFGRIDAFANNAGIEGPSALIEDLAVEDFDRVHAINVRGVFLGLKSVLPVMKAQGAGSIVNTASLASLWGLPMLGAYISSKHAVAGLTKVAAVEAAGHGVRVNAVLPGTINTGMMRRIEAGTGDAEASRQANAAATPLQRYGEPEEVAAVVDFLLSDESSFVTSSLYTVDGGAVWQ